MGRRFPDASSSVKSSDAQGRTAMIWISFSWSCQCCCDAMLDRIDTLLDRGVSTPRGENWKVEA